MTVCNYIICISNNLNVQTANIKFCIRDFFLQSVSSIVISFVNYHFYIMLSKASQINPKLKRNFQWLRPL